MEFEAGQAVQLENRPPKTMKVMSVEGDHVVCGWEDDDGVMRSLKLPADAIKIVPPDTGEPVPFGCIVDGRESAD